MKRVPKPRRGVPPFGHKTHRRVFIDPDLPHYDEVWAAAGTWHDVFGIDPIKLVEASGRAVTDLKRLEGRHVRTADVPADSFITERLEQFSRMFESESFDRQAFGGSHQTRQSGGNFRSPQVADEAVRSPPRRRTAGTWHEVFGLEPHKLVGASGGAVTDPKCG